MRRHTGVAGVVLGITVTLSSLAGAAAASPVFYSKAAIGQTVPGVYFTATVGANYWSEPGQPYRVLCQGGTAEGFVSSATGLKDVILRFTGCEGFGCPSTVETAPLEGELGALTQALPGIRLWSEKEGRGGKIAECPQGWLVATGSVIGSLSGAAGNEAANGKLALSDKLYFTESYGVQKFTKFEGEASGEQMTFSTNGGKAPGAWEASLTLKSVPSADLGFTK